MMSQSFPGNPASPGRYAASACARVALLAVALIPALAFAADGEDGLEWGTMSMNLLGGLALFLFGMDQMADALKAVAGARMKDILGKLTTSRFMGLLTGALVTAVIQSSSVTTVMLVGFVSANLMSLSQAIGVILGADIGTTVTAQIVAFKVTKYALLLVAVGFALIFTGPSEKATQYGRLLMGLGLIFFGMGVMSEAMRPLRTYEPFLNLMHGVENPLVGIAIATVFTGVVQSSSAAMGVVIALSLQGLVSLEGGIALALGANIGTCVTAGLASIGKPREAVRVAVAHVSFKIVGVLLIVWFIPQLAELVRAVSPTAAPGVTGIDKLAAETPRQIANAHTIFNIGIAVLFLPLAAQFARFCEWVVPDRPLAEGAEVVVRAKYLDEALLTTPALALDRTRLEVLHIGEYVQEMLARILPAIYARDRQELRAIKRLDDKVDILHRATIGYLGKLSQGSMSEAQTQEFIRLMEAVNSLENIGDLVETDLVGLGEKLLEEGVSISDETQQVLLEIHRTVIGSVDAAIQAVSQSNEVAAAAVTSMKDDLNRLFDSAVLHEARRLVAKEPNRVPAYTIEVDIIEKLKRVYYFSKRMAKTVTPEALLQESA